MRKKFDPTDIETIEKIKKVMGVSDWEVTVTVYSAEEEPNKPVCGENYLQPEYRRSRIHIYESGILESQKSFPSESEKSVLYHEIAEIAAYECTSIIPESKKHTPQFMQLRDMFAERLSKSVLLAEEKKACSSKRPKQTGG